MTTDTLFVTLASAWANTPSRRVYTLGPTPATFTWEDGTLATIEDIGEMVNLVNDEERALMGEAQRVFGETYSPDLPDSAVAALFAHAETDVWNSMGEFESLEESEPEFWDSLASSYQTLVRLVATVNAAQA